jgi:mono/diheme cytochrome c family protein
VKKFLILATLIAVAAITPLATSLQGAQTGGASAPSAPDAKKGGALYQKYGCWECHGYTGATGNGATLVTTSFNANGFTNYIRAPRTAGMPIYSAKIVPDTEAADIFAFIKTFKKPAEAKDIPLLQQIINEK